MPKANHGPEPKAAPPSLVVLLREIEDRPFAADLWIKVNGAIERAEVLEERLTELHDAVEAAIQDLNAREDLAVTERENLVETALSRLNRVL
jgi:hypothetical protein